MCSVEVYQPTSVIFQISVTLNINKQYSTFIKVFIFSEITIKLSAKQLIFKDCIF